MLSANTTEVKKHNSVFKNLQGMRFGRLTVLNEAHSDNSNIKWLCVCDCGNQTTVYSSSLLRGKTKSCGCYNLECVSKRSTTHAQSRTKSYITWGSMKDRCLNSQDNGYPDYGGRGIKVCDRWKDSFENFLEDMGEAPKGLTLDRIDVNGDYEPTNCRWATWKEQQRNRRNNHRLWVGNREATIPEIAEFFGVSYWVVYYNARKHKDDPSLKYLKRRYKGDFEARLEEWNNLITESFGG